MQTRLSLIIVTVIFLFIMPIILISVDNLFIVIAGCAIILLAFWLENKIFGKDQF